VGNSDIDLLKTSKKRGSILEEEFEDEKVITLVSLFIVEFLGNLNLEIFLEISKCNHSYTDVD